MWKLLLFLCLAAAQAESVPLGTTKADWRPVLFEVADADRSAAAEFAVWKGGVLSVGRWRSGANSARFEYAAPLAVVSGSVTGSYRTEGVGLNCVSVYVSFYDGTERRLARQDFRLAPAAGWKRFRFPIRRAPAGSKTLTPGFGLSGKTEGRVSFKDLAVSSDPYVIEYPEEPGPITRPAPRKRFEAARFVRVTNDRGAWWLVRPDGRPFFSMGTDGPSFSDPKTGQAYLEKMLGLGFNSLAGWSDIKSWSRLEDPPVMFRALQTGTMAGEYDRLAPGNHAFPDPFDPRWEAALRANIRKTAQLVRGDARFAGFFADNEIDHRDLHRHVYTPHAASALRSFLKTRYGSIERLNRAWASDFASFDDLIRRKPDPAVRYGRMFDAYRAFKREVVKRYVQTVVRILREEDPGHMAISNRFMLGDAAEWLDVIDLYSAFDIIGVNLYPANLNAGLSEGERELYRTVWERTGRPVMVPEWSVAALDSGLYNNPAKLDWSYREAVDTQQQRARQAAQIVTDFYNMPFMVGAHWFIWKDIDSSVRQANRGLFKADGSPWMELQSALRQAAARINKHFAAD